MNRESIEKVVTNYLQNTFFKSQEFHDLVFDNAKYILEGRFEIKSEPKNVYTINHFIHEYPPYGTFNCQSVFTSEDKAICALRKRFIEIDGSYDFEIERMEFDSVHISWLERGSEKKQHYYIVPMKLDVFNKEDL